jgi:tagatose 6-phosphate kinase
MIVTVTLNPALDLTYSVEALVPHDTHRVTTVAEHPGGKGVNVARVLHSLGEPVLATGLLGGATGGRVGELLAAEGVPTAFVPINGESRRTVAVVDPRNATGFWEPGPDVSAVEWLRFVDRFHDLLGQADVVTLSGSLPAGLPPDAYATLIRLATAAGVPTVLDTSGTALRHGLAAAPTVTKPNLDELATLHPARPGPTDLPAAVRAVTTADVVVSRGADGLVAVTGEGSWAGAPPAPLDGNPTGAGDACVAALARGLRDRTPWTELLADAVALAAAAVAAPVAGAVDHDVYRGTLPHVTVAPAPSGGSRVRIHR